MLQRIRMDPARGSDYSNYVVAYRDALYLGTVLLMRMPAGHGRIMDVQIIPAENSIMPAYILMTAEDGFQCSCAVDHESRSQHQYSRGTGREHIEILNQLMFNPGAPLMAAPLVCFDCRASGLEHFFTSREGGYHLCPGCFEGRRAKGQAKEVEESTPRRPSTKAPHPLNQL